jgi:ubiquitin carboxyl-terminal hydrolase 4/11
MKLLSVNPMSRNGRKRKFRSHRPTWVDPKVYLKPELQNMFDLSYFTGTKELVPVGWGSVDEDKEYPKLSSRDPRLLNYMDEDETLHDGLSMVNGRIPSDDNSDADEEDAPQLVGPTRMADESSDEGETFPANSITTVCPCILVS